MATKTITATVADFSYYAPNTNTVKTFSFSLPSTAKNISATLTFHYKTTGASTLRVIEGSTYSTSYGLFSMQYGGIRDGDHTIKNTDGYGMKISAGATSHSFIFANTSGSAATYFTNLKLTITYEDSDHSITVNSATGGTLSASASTATAGSTVTLTASPSTGYSFGGVTSSPSVTFSGSGNTRTFTMPDQAITITPSWTKNKYSVTVSSATGGTLSASSSSVEYGATVTLTASPSTGYSFNGATTSPTLTLSGSGNTRTFTMPAQNVTVTPSWTQNKYTVKVNTSPAGAGTVSASPTGSQPYGTQITLSQTPAAGYFFVGWTGATVSNNKFTMPASNVTVTALYLKRSTATLSSSSLTGGSSVTLTISADSKNYSHKYQLSFGTGMATGEVSVAAGTTSVKIDVPVSWSNSVTTATSKTGGSLTLKTFSGTTQIGTYTISSLTYNVPTSVVPSVGTVSAIIARTIGNVTYANVGDYYVQNHSGVTISSGTCAGSYGSTITSIKITGNALSHTKTGATSTSATSGLLSVSGTNTYTVTVTDSRGRTASKTKDITVTAYTAPKITSFGAWRVNASGVADQFGTYGQYSKSHTYTSVGSNALTVKLECSGVSATNPANSGNLMPSSRLTFNILNPYDVKLTVSDKFESVSSTIQLPSANFIMHFNAAGNAVAFGQTATSPNRFTISDSLTFYYGNKRIVFNSNGTVTWTNG